MKIIIAINMTITISMMIRTKKTTLNIITIIKTDNNTNDSNTTN